MNTNGKVKSVLDQKNEYKNTVFGFIPKDWEIVKLKDISIRKGTYGIGAAAVEYNENLPRYLRITDIDDQGRIINEDPKCVDDPDSVNYILKKNDLVFARTGNTTGKTYLYKNEDGVLVYAGFLIKFSINPIKADSRFVKYFTETNYYWQWVGIMSMRSGQPGINENEYSKLTLPLPPLPEQQKISSILSTWDKAIELKEKLIEQKKEQKKGLMQKLLTREVRLPGFEGAWKKVRLEEVSVCLDNLRKPLNSTERERMRGDIPYYGANGIVDYVNDYLFDEPLILLAEDGGHFNEFSEKPIAMKVEGKVWVNNHAHILRITNSDIDFVFYSLVHKDIRKYINGSTRGKLTQSDMLSIEIVLPNSLEEQKAISRILNTISKEIDLINDEINLLKSQKKGLTQLLLTGKMRVQV